MYLLLIIKTSIYIVRNIICIQFFKINSCLGVLVWFLFGFPINTFQNIASLKELFLHHSMFQEASKNPEVKSAETRRECHLAN